MRRRRAGMLSLRLVQGQMHLHSTPTTTQKAANGLREVRIAFPQDYGHAQLHVLLIVLIRVSNSQSNTNVLQDQQKTFSVLKTVLFNLKQESRLMVVEGLRIQRQMTLRLRGEQVIKVSRPRLQGRTTQIPISAGDPFATKNP